MSIETETTTCRRSTSPPCDRIPQTYKQPAAHQPAAPQIDPNEGFRSIDPSSCNTPSHNQQPEESRLINQQSGERATPEDGEPTLPDIPPSASNSSSQTIRQRHLLNLITRGMERENTPGIRNQNRSKRKGNLSKNRKEENNLAVV